MLTQDQIDAFHAELNRQPVSDHPFSQMIRLKEEVALDALLSGNYSLWIETSKFDLYKRIYLSHFPVSTLAELRRMTEHHQHGSVLLVLNGCHPEDAYDHDMAHTELHDTCPFPPQARHHFWLGEFDPFGCIGGVLLGILLPRTADAPEVHSHDLSAIHHLDDLDSDYVTYINEHGMQVIMPREMYEKMADRTGEKVQDYPTYLLN